jgi:hypothetical protein
MTQTFIAILGAQFVFSASVTAFWYVGILTAQPFGMVVVMAAGAVAAVSALAICFAMRVHEKLLTTPAVSGSTERKLESSRRRT